MLRSGTLRILPRCPDDRAEFMQIDASRKRLVMCLSTRFRRLGLAGDDTDRMLVPVGIHYLEETPNVVRVSVTSPVMRSSELWIAHGYHYDGGTLWMEINGWEQAWEPIDETELPDEAVKVFQAAHRRIDINEAGFLA